MREEHVARDAALGQRQRAHRQAPPRLGPAVPPLERLVVRGREAQAGRLPDVHGAGLRAREASRLREERVDGLRRHRAGARRRDRSSAVATRVVARELRTVAPQPLERRATLVRQLVERHHPRRARGEWSATGEQTLVAPAHLHGPEVRRRLVQPELAAQSIHGKRPHEYDPQRPRHTCPARKNAVFGAAPPGAAGDSPPPVVASGPRMTRRPI